MANLRTSLVLTASFVDSEVITLVHPISAVVLDLTYTRGADGGYAAFRLLESLDGERWTYVTVQDTALTVSAPFAAQRFYAGQWGGPAPADGSALNFSSPLIKVSPLAKLLKAQFAEVGVAGTPGILAAAIYTARASERV